MAEWRTSRVRYGNGQEKIIGYLYADFPLVWDLEQAANSSFRPNHFASQLFLLSYPNQNMLLGYGTPRCLPPSGHPWNWVQLIEVGPRQAQGWWYANCYDMEELVRWVKGADMPSRTYQLRSSGIV